MAKKPSKTTHKREEPAREIRSPLQVVVRLVLVALMVLLLIGFAVAVVRLISRPSPVAEVGLTAGLTVGLAVGLPARR